MPELWTSRSFWEPTSPATWSTEVAEEGPFFWSLLQEYQEASTRNYMTSFDIPSTDKKSRAQRMRPLGLRYDAMSLMQNGFRRPSLERSRGPRNSFRAPILGTAKICYWEPYFWEPNPFAESDCDCQIRQIWETFEINHGWCHSQKGWYFHSWQSGKHQFSSSFAFIFLQSIGENTIFLYQSKKTLTQEQTWKGRSIVQMHIIIQSLIILNTDTKGPQSE